MKITEFASVTSVTKDDLIIVETSAAGTKTSKASDLRKSLIKVQEFSSVYTWPSIAANGTASVQSGTTITIPEGYDVLGVGGWSVSGSSNVAVRMLYVTAGGELHIAVINNGEAASNVTVNLRLILVLK